MIWHGIAFGLCCAAVVLGWYFSGLLRIVAVVFFLISPFLALGFFASRKLMKEHQSRLEDCERRLSVGR
jgi:Flp pilus assembly protein TadB